MIVFEVLLNGRRVARAGAKDLSVLAADISAVGKLGSSTLVRGGGSRDLFLMVGGLTGRKRKPDEHLDWIPHRKIKIGDEVLVKVLESASVDQPCRRKRSDRMPAVPERERFEYAKELYYRLRRKYEGAGRIQRAARQ